MSKKQLTREDISSYLRIGKSLKCGDTWFTVEKFSKTCEGMLIRTAAWELNRGKNESTQIVTYDELLKNINSGDWMVKINGEDVGGSSSVMEGFLKNVSDAEFEYEMKQIPSTYSKNVHSIVRKLFDFFTDSAVNKAFDVGIGYIRPKIIRRYVLKMKTMLRKKDGHLLPDTVLKDGIVALQLGNGAGPVIFLDNDGSLFIEKFMTDGTSKGLVHFTDFSDAREAIHRLKANLLTWANKTENVKESSQKDDEETEEATMSMKKEVHSAILSEDIARRRYPDYLAELSSSDGEDEDEHLAEKDADEDEDDDDADDEDEDEEDEDEDDKDESADEDENDLNEDQTLTDEEYEENILATPPRNLMFDQKAYIGTHDDLMSAYEDKWGYVPVSGIPNTGSDPEED